MKAKTNDPTFIDQAFVLIEDHYKKGTSSPGMNIMDHKLNVKIMDLHLQCMKIENDIQNEQFKSKLIGDVVEVIQNELRPIQNVMKETQKEICELRQQVTTLNDQVRKITFRNSIWMILLRMLITIAATYFLIKFAHDHWWSVNLIALW